MEVTLEQALQQGIEAHKAGRAEEADRYYTAILKVQPNHPDANHNMGVLAVGIGRVQEGLPFFKAALEANPSIAQFWLSYIDALIKLERMEDAKGALELAKSKGAQGDGFDQLESKLSVPNESEVLTDEQFILEKACKLQDEGKYDQAINLLQINLDKLPKKIDGLALLARCYISINNLEKADKCIELAKTEDPNIPSIGVNEARLLLKKNKKIEALSVASETYKRYPHDIESIGVYGSCLRLNGRLEDSQKYLKKAIELHPNYAEAIINRGLLRLTMMDKRDALLDLERAFQLKPHLHQIWTTILELKMNFREFENAISLSKEMLKIDPLNEKILATVAICYQELKNFDQAIIHYEKALKIKPDYLEALVNLGSSVKDKGDLEEAIKIYDRVLAINPRYAMAYFNRGVALTDLGLLEDALGSYKSAIKFDSNNVQVLNNIGAVCQKLGKLAEGIDAIKQAISLNPVYAEAHNNLGIILQEEGKFNEAMSAFERAISIRPDFIATWYNGATTLEKWNKIDQLEIWLERAITSIASIPDDLKLMYAKLHWRKENYKDAFSEIMAIKFENISFDHRQEYLILKAKCYEKYADYDAAFGCYERSNSLIKVSPTYHSFNPDKYFQNSKNELLKLQNSIVEKNISNAEGLTSLSPIFLVGFPRSGTTLLETMLRSHSKIKVAEEQSMLDDVEDFLIANGCDDFISQSIPKALSTEARGLYELELEKCLGKCSEDTVFIDKLPLNLLKSPLINQLYPNAKFILALRHPMDSVLSCWMQNFKLNPAMANMLDLERATEFYDVAMETFKISRSKFGLNVIETRYEDLVNDFQNEVKRILEFLNLEWEQGIQEYQTTAYKRGRINTPSYSQVVKPIYTDARYRWVKYRKHLEQYLIHLDQWIDEFGYKSREE